MTTSFQSKWTDATCPSFLQLQSQGSIGRGGVVVVGCFVGSRVARRPLGRRQPESHLRVSFGKSWLHSKCIRRFSKHFWDEIRTALAQGVNSGLAKQSAFYKYMGSFENILLLFFQSFNKGESLRQKHHNPLDRDVFSYHSSLLAMKYFRRRQQSPFKTTFSKHLHAISNFRVTTYIRVTS